MLVSKLISLYRDEREFSSMKFRLSLYENGLIEKFLMYMLNVHRKLLIQYTILGKFLTIFLYNNLILLTSLA